MHCICYIFISKYELLRLVIIAGINYVRVLCLYLHIYLNIVLMLAYSKSVFSSWYYMLLLQSIELVDFFNLLY